MPKNVLLVHGYSVRSLSTYGQLPELFVSEGIVPSDIVLSAFDSLDNSVTCDDLAAALEGRVSMLEAGGLVMVETAVIAHSTGAMIVRRWLLDRANRGLPLPSHFVSLAGSNHGSTLAQVGQSLLNRLRLKLQGADGIGQQVLSDLDYGSGFLMSLNRDWLDSLGKISTRCFSLVGDDHSEPADQILWQSHEPGSDSTVRVSGANMNYRWLAADGATATISTVGSANDTAFLILPHYSHTGPTGIIDALRTTRDAPFAAIMSAFNVLDDAGYRALTTSWATENAAWSTAPVPQGTPSQCCSMIVFRLLDDVGREILDSAIIFQVAGGQPQDLNAFASHPVQNQVNGSIVSFYITYPAFVGDVDHPQSIEFEISAKSQSSLVDYLPAAFAINSGQLIAANETTYVDVTLRRDTSKIYATVGWDTNPDMNKQWLPLP